MNGKMKAIKMYAPKDLRLEQADIPVIKSNKALVKVMAVGVCGSDIPRINKYGAYISPIIPGHEFAGKIVETGEELTGFKPGDRVTVPPLMPCNECTYCKSGHFSLCEKYSYFGSRCDGAFAQYVAVPKQNLLKIADNVSYAAGATTDPLANALHSIKRGRMQAGDKVCVMGTGPIGLYALQYMAGHGASQVIAVDVNDEKLEIAKKCGAKVCINALKEDVVKGIKEVTGGGADLIIDCSGVPSGQLNAILSTAKLGRMVFLGISHKPLELSEKAVDWIMRAEIDVIGSWNSFSEPFPGWEWTYGVELLSEGKIDAEKIITHKLELEDVPETFKKIDMNEIFFNKILFFPWGKNV